MKLLVSGCTKTTKRMMGARPDRFGILLTPSNGNREWWDESVTWACDNDCYNGLDASAYMRMLAKIVKFQTRPAWVSCPDVVGDATETLRRFTVWQPLLSELGLSAALVSQDGLRSEQVPWESIACLFVGGSDAWKCCDESMALTLEARRRGKLVHFGRVNTMRRITFIARQVRDGLAWCDTFDGTGFSAYGDKRMPMAVRWTDKAMADKQMVLWGGTP